MNRTYAALLIALLLACKQRAAAPAHTSKALEQVDWMRGDWIAQTGLGAEHWVLAGGALYGIAFAENDRFEVMVIDDAAGPGPAGTDLRLYAMPGGKAPVEFQAISTESSIGKHVAKFANPRHDFPTQVIYQLDTGNVLRAEASNAARNEQVAFARAVTPSRAPALEAADKAYSASTANGGIVAWLAGFEETGWIVRGEDKIERAAIRDRMKTLLDNGTLSWTPIASGVHGTLGYTVGTATFKVTTGRTTLHTTYARIWAKQADGTWKVRFDTDRAINR